MKIVHPVLKTVPASAFCDKATQTPAVAATMTVVATELKRSLSERLDALEAKSASNDAEIEMLKRKRTANRVDIDRLKRKSAANDEEIEMLKRKRTANRVDIDRLKRKSAANDAVRATSRDEMERLRSWLEDWRNSNILITRFREVSRTVMAFFNVIYATWVLNHPRPQKYNNAKFLDKSECPLNEDCSQTDGNDRHRRALDFLRDMWSGFDGIDMDVTTWNGLRAFIHNTNDACHTVPRAELGNTVESIIARERSSPPRIDRAAATKMLNTILPLITAFGNGKWSTKIPKLQKSANAKAFEHRSRFKNFPEWWP